jgi:hypothetical protein
MPYPGVSASALVKTQATNLLLALLTPVRKVTQPGNLAIVTLHISVSPVAESCRIRETTMSATHSTPNAVG